ncbi:PPOX class F420-dependent oxidoreductase [Nocardia sp. NPDC003345]
MAFTDDPDGDRFFALRTFRADGSPVATPIWLAPAGDRWYAYTPVHSHKVARIAERPEVEVARSTFDGTPTGMWRTGTARILVGRERRIAERAMAAKYGLEFRIFVLTTLLGRFRPHGGRAVGLEIEIPDGLPRLRR